MGGFIVADVVAHVSGLYQLGPYLQICIKFICAVGNAVGFLWVFVCTGNAKKQLWRKYPTSFGRIFEFLDKRRGWRPNDDAARTASGVGYTTDRSVVSSIRHHHDCVILDSCE